jgi:hypothetical protein
VDGSLDADFNSGGNWGGSAGLSATGGRQDPELEDLTTASSCKHRIARLKPDGSPDSGFNQAPAWRTISLISIADLKRNGQIVYCRAFSSVAGVSRNNIARSQR